MRRRERAQRSRLDQGITAGGWLLDYQRRRQRLRDSLANLPGTSEGAERLREQCAELDRKSVWRGQQQTRALREARHAIVTLRSREIAELTNSPVGTVRAQVTRLRRELRSLLESRDGQAQVS